MKVKILEVWNAEGKSQELATIEVSSQTPRSDIRSWIEEHRPDLRLANDPYSHGFYAVEI